MAPTLPGRKARYTITELARIVVWVGFQGTAAARAVAIIMAESGGRTGAQHRVGSEGGRAEGSIDRGLMQINSYWHPEVSNTCAYDPYCNVSAGWRISGHGTNFHPWSTFNSGAYRQFFNAAAEAVSNVGGAVSGVPIRDVRGQPQGKPSTLDQALDWVLGPLNWGPIGWLKSHIKAVILAGGRYVYAALRPLIHMVGVAAGHALHLIGILEKKVRRGFHDLHVWAHNGFVAVRKWVLIGLRNLEKWARRLVADVYTWVRREVWAPLKRAWDATVKWVRTTVIPFLERAINTVKDWARRAVDFLHNLIRTVEHWARRAIDFVLDLIRPVLAWFKRFGNWVVVFFTKALGWVEWMVKYPPTVIVSLVVEGFRRAPRALIGAVLNATLRHAREIEDVLVRWLG